MLPLLAGIAVGVGAVVAYNNKEELKEKIASSAKIVQESAIKAKDAVVDKVSSSKKEKSKEETIEDKDEKDTK